MDKLTGRKGPLLTADQMLRLLEILAEEMWWQETRILDADTLRTLAELASEEFQLGQEETRILVNRVASNAMLAMEGGIKLQFAHEYYYAYFLAQFLVRSSKSPELSEVLCRSTLSDVVASEAADVLAASGEERVKEFVGALSSRRVRTVSREVDRRNVGVLVGALIRKWARNWPARPSGRQSSSTPTSTRRSCPR